MSMVVELRERTPAFPVSAVRNPETLPEDEAPEWTARLRPSIQTKRPLYRGSGHRNETTMTVSCGSRTADRPASVSIAWYAKRIGH